MTHPSGPSGDEPGAVEYPPIDYQPMPPPGYGPPAGYGPPPGVYGPPPGPYPPPLGSYPPPGGYPPPGCGVPPGQPTTNGLAVGSLVCGLTSLPGYILCIGFPLGLIAVVLGIVALTQIKPQNGQKGKEMAIAGIVVGALGLLGLGALVAVGSMPTL